MDCRAVNNSRLGRGVLAVFCLLLAVGSRLLAQQQENMTEEMVPNSWVIFAAHDCPDCETLKQQFLPELQAEYGLILPPVFLVYIDAPEGYALLTEVETMLGIRCDTFPALLAGHEMYGGINNIRAAREQLAMAVLSETPLGELLPLLQANVDLCLPLSTPARASGSPAGTSTSQEVPTDYRNADILYFAAEGCRECGRTEVMLDYAQTLFPDRKIARVSVLAKEGRLLQMAVAARLGVPHSMNTAVPMIVSGTEVIYGGNITDSEIQQLLHTAPASPFWRDWDEEAEFQAASTRITRMARQFTWLGVLAAGLADGINPCAFAVIVFFVSYLMLARNLSRWEALFQGGMFCLGVFLCYLLIGIGLTGVLHFIGKFPGLRYGIFLGMAVFAFACAAAAFYDALRAKRLNPAAMRFGMPKKASALAHRTFSSRTAGDRRACPGICGEQPGTGLYGTNLSSGPGRHQFRQPQLPLPADALGVQPGIYRTTGCGAAPRHVWCPHRASDCLGPPSCRPYAHHDRFAAAAYRPGPAGLGVVSGYCSWRSPSPSACCSASACCAFNCSSCSRTAGKACSISTANSWSG
jgi:hypothetical protein